MARELKGLVAGLIAGLGVVGAAYGVSAIVSHSQPAAATGAASAAQKNTAPQTSSPSPVVATGRGLYLASCSGCHGKDGMGRIGPTLHHLGDPDAKIAASIKNGFKGQMPGFKDKYTDTQISALVAYIQSLN